MAYFSNATELADYEHRVCGSCVHHRKGEEESCPVMLAHVVYGYDGSDEVREVLDILIPRLGAGNKICALYHRCEDVDAGQGRLL